MLEWFIAGRSSGGGSVAAVVAMVEAAVVAAALAATATAAMGVAVNAGLSTHQPCFSHIHTASFVVLVSLII